MSEHTPQFDAFRLAIRHVLLNDWDPHNAARWPEASATYDTYIEPLAELIQQGANEEQIVDWLHAREQESMCFPSLGTKRLNRIARLLLETPSHKSLR
jgi:hypothetical protein